MSFILFYIIRWAWQWARWLLYSCLNQVLEDPFLQGWHLVFISVPSEQFGVGGIGKIPKHQRLSARGVGNGERVFRLQSVWHTITFPEHHVAAPTADYLWLFAPPLHKCSIALVLLIPVQKYDVNGKKGTCYLQARKTKIIPSLTGDLIALPRNWTWYEGAWVLGLACV